jgi:hypothetical protein
MNGMTKLIYSGALPQDLGYRMDLIGDRHVLTKSASVFSAMDLDDVKPDKDHVLLHVVALGDSEHYGFNRNGDGFPKKACENYHHTFVDNGHVYKHHKNKDPEKKSGDIVKSAYCADMGRIELILHAHKEKCADEIQKIATTGEVPFSMACKVAFDRCSICDNVRSSSRDPKQCDHVKYDLGKMASDGRVTGTYNDEPNYFDMSFVYRPADRIAWNLKMASGEGEELVDSVKLAEVSGIWTPPHLTIISKEAQAKYAIFKKLAEYEQFYMRLAETTESKMSRRERELWELRKAAVDSSFDDQTITSLRDFETQDVFESCAKNNIIMDPMSYCKYAMGTDLGELAEHKDEIINHINSGLFTKLAANDSVGICNDSFFDVDTSGYYDLADNSALNKLIVSTLDRSSFEDKRASHRAVSATIDGKSAALSSSVDFSGENSVSPVAKGVAERYASYKVAAIVAAQNYNTATDVDRQMALLAAQHLIKNS